MNTVPLPAKKAFHLTFTVEGLSEPERADVYCCKKMPDITRSKLKTGLTSFFLNGSKAKISKYVHNGDRIGLIWTDPNPSYAQPEAIPLDILYEDCNIIAVNKCAGLVVHPASGNPNGTLVNALNYYRLFVSNIKDEFSDIVKNFMHGEKKSTPLCCNEAELFRLGIVHRLDKDTSGVIITARNTKTEKLLKKMFKQRKVKKYYLAVLNGVPILTKGRIKTSVFRSKGDRKKFSVSADLSKGKTALSAYKVLKHNGAYALVLFRIFTGRTHQIRLHSRFIGCPVLGDRLYGKKNRIVSDCPLMLHAHKTVIRIAADVDEEGSTKGIKQGESKRLCSKVDDLTAPPERLILKTFTAPLPEQFKKLLRTIKL